MVSGSLRLALMVLCVSRLASAGWDVIPTGVTDDLKAVTFVNADTGYAAGSRGTVLRTGDAGKSWTPIQVGSTTDFTGVHFVDARRGFLCGLTGTILRTTDSGKTWSKAVTPDSGVRLTDIRFASPAVGFGMGKVDSILATVDSGKTWTMRSVYGGTKRPLITIRTCFPTDQVGYLVSLVQVFKTRDGGATWNPIAGLSWGSSYLSDCWFSNPDTGLIGAITYGSLSLTRNGGETTRMVMGHSVSRIAFINSDVGFTHNGFTIYRTVNGGNDWTLDWQRRNDGSPQFQLSGIAVTRGSIVVMTGSNGTIFRKDDSAPTVVNRPGSPGIQAPAKTRRYRLDGRSQAKAISHRASPVLAR